MATADQNQTVMESAEALLAQSEYEVVDVECLGEPRGLTVRIYIDKDGGVNLEDCARLTRGLESHFEAEEVFSGRYTLEVSSPGIDRPVRKAGDFARFAGEVIRVVTYERVQGRTKHTGVLKGFDGESNCVLVEGDSEVVSIPLSAIKKSHLKRDPWAEAKARAKS